MNRRTRLRALTATLAVSAGVVTGVPMAASADTGTPVTSFPLGGHVTDVLYDAARQHVFTSDAASVNVFGLNGGRIATVSGGDILQPADMAASGDGKWVFAAERDRPWINAIETTSYVKKGIPLDPAICPGHLAFTGGKLWFDYKVCGTDGTGFGSFDPTTGDVTTADLALGTAEELTALGDRPDRLVFTGTAGHTVVDVSGATPVALATFPDVHGSVTPLSPTDELAMAPLDGTPLAIRPATDPAATPRLVNEYDKPKAVTVTPDNGFMTVVATRGTTDLVGVVGLKSGAIAREIALPGVASEYDVIAGSDGTVLATGTDTATNDRTVYVLRGATRFDTSLTASLPSTVRSGKAFTVSGVLTGAPANALLTMTRTDRSGTRTATTRAAADGSFSFKATADVTGSTQITVDYAGESVYPPATWTGDLWVRALPWDFNGDGYVDVVTGTPLEDTGNAVDTGQFHVFYNGPSGVTPSRSQLFDQNTPGVPGTNETGDRLGQVQASGDFNGDGFADLAVSAPGEDDTTRDTGMVEVFFGWTNGLAADATTSIWGPKGYHYAFGSALAAGDFDGDGADDLAVGGPSDQGGDVWTYSFNTAGFAAAGQPVGVNLNGQNGLTATATVPDDRFGWSLATGDVNGDGRDDLAIGIPHASFDRGWPTGAVGVFTTGIDGWNDPQWITKNTAGVPGSAGKYEPRVGDGADEFGLRIQLADFNGDGKADLAASAPGSAVSGVTDAGTVTVLYSNGYAIGTSGAVELSQNSPGIVGAAGNNDFFGDTIAAGDANGDGIADLAVFSYGDEYMSVIPGSKSGLVTTKSVWWNQNSPDVPGSQEAGDKWGASMRFLGGAKPALLVGAPGEDSRQGAFTVLYIGTTGLTGKGSKYFCENSAGVLGTSENGDRFGTF